MEDPEVFETAHALLFRLIADGFVTGLRIDHPDGLLDPLAYAERLQARIGALLNGEVHSRTRPFYVTVEKILATGEPLPCALGGARHDHLSLPQPREQRARRRPQRTSPAPHVHAADPTPRIVRRPGLLLQAVDHVLVDGERAQRAGARAQRSVGKRSTVARLHAQRPAQGADGGDCLPPGLPHLCERPRDRRSRSPRRRHRDRGSAAAQSGARAHDLRFPAKRDAARGAAPGRVRPDRPRTSADVRDEAAAVHRPGLRQGGRGHRVLPLSRAGLAQRSGRRPVTVRPHRSRSFISPTPIGSNAGRSR